MVHSIVDWCVLRYSVASGIIETFRRILGEGAWHAL
jgi:hypothetical protein